MVVAGIVETMNSQLAEAVCVKGLAEEFDPRHVGATFVAAADCVQLQAVMSLQGLDPSHVVIAHILRPEISIADPAWTTPGAGVEREGRVAPFGLGHEPPLVAAAIVLIVPGAHVRRFGPLGGVPVAALFDVKRLHGGGKLRFEEDVENLAALRLRIILEQHRGGTSAADSANAFKYLSRGAAIKGQYLAWTLGEPATRAGKESQRDEQANNQAFHG